MRGEFKVSTGLEWKNRHLVCTTFGMFSKHFDLTQIKHWLYSFLNIKQNYNTISFLIELINIMVCMRMEFA